MENDDQLMKKFYLTLDLHQAGIDMMRQNLHRRFPQASHEDIQAKLVAWLRNRPPDSPGRPYTFKYNKSLDTL